MRDFASSVVGTVSFAALSLAVLCAGPVVAEPTAEQVAAIKANCRSDYMSYCWSVPRGGPEAAQCLKQNLAKLSPGCAQAVKAATAAAAPPGAPAPAKQESAPAPKTEPSPEPAATTAAPAAPDTQPATDTGATAKAAPAPKAGVDAPAKPSAPAQSATAPSSAPLSAKTREPAAPEAPAAAPAGQPGAASAATEAAPLVIGVIPPRKKLMILKNCRKDLDAFCASVSYGEGRQLSCLFSNKASLSPDCQGVLAKLTR